MESSISSPLSREELQNRVNELEGKLAHMKELMSKVREHKHNYSQTFGTVVSTPVKRLLNELISNPNAFSIEERDRIIKVYAISMEMKGKYDCLGLSVETQLFNIKNSIIPDIRNNAEFYASLIGKTVNFKDTGLVSVLQFAKGKVDDLCSKLENIEHFEYGESKPFNLKNSLLSAFDKENYTISIEGGKTINLNTSFGDEFSDVMVDMNEKSFQSCFLDNIIKNLHDHAFKEFDNFSKSHFPEEHPSLWKRLLLFFKIRKEESEPLGIMDSNSTPFLEKKVRISLEKDPDDRHRINLVIENNGKEFDGDVNTVFDKGVGDGTGIGLYSAKQFLKHYGGTIKMYTNNQTEYKVRFLINLPIL